MSLEGMMQKLDDPIVTRPPLTGDCRDGGFVISMKEMFGGTQQTY
jgi:hypothetical protein